MAKLSLADLKNTYAPAGDSTSQGPQFTNNYYPFWDMAPNQRAVVRFLPDINENNPRGFLVEKVMHSLTINDKERKIPCLTMYGEDCPICKISQAYYRAKDEINGKKYWKKRQYLGQALIVEDPLPPNAETGETHEGKVRMIALGFQIYNIIKDAFSSDELEGVPYDFEEGYDFIIKKTEKGKYADYSVGTKFANKQRALSESELMIVQEQSIDLSTLLPKHPGSEKVQAMLDAEMNGEEYEDSNDAPARMVPQSKATPARSASEDEDDDTPFVTKPASTAASASESTDVDDMLAQIRARRKQS